MSALDNAAVFRARALGVGLTPTDVDAMAARGWSSYSTFGYATSAIPGQTDDTAFTRDILVTILGAACFDKGLVGDHELWLAAFLVCACAQGASCYASQAQDSL